MGFTNAMADFVQVMVKRPVNSEIQYQKQGHYERKRLLPCVSRFVFKDSEDEMNVLNESPPKKVCVCNGETSSDICTRDNDRLEKEQQKCTVRAADLKIQDEQLKDLNEMCQIQLSRLETALAVTGSSQCGMSTVVPPGSSSSVTTPTSEEWKSRILIAPCRLSTPHQFRHLNIHSNSLSVNQHLTMKQVTSLAYLTKGNKLLIGLRNPDNIVSYTLSTRHMTVLTDHVWTYGIAVDEDRDFIFMSTFNPGCSISRMSTQGKDLTVIVDLSRFTCRVFQISLDTKRKRIYGCTGGILFTVAYDGQDLKTLAVGNGIYAVVQDQAAGVLYYAIKNKLMKMTVSNNVSRGVTTLTADPWNMTLYRGTIYYSGFRSPVVGAVDVTNNTSGYTLQSLSIEGASTFCICMIP